MPGATSSRAGARAERPAAITIAAGAVAGIVAHARREAPRECCGLLLGAPATVDAIVPARNLARGVARYRVDPRDHFRAIRIARAAGLAVVGAYHSHPRSPATPSPTDVAEAAFDDFLYLIVSLAGTRAPVVRAYRPAARAFVRVRLVRREETERRRSRRPSTG